MDVRTNSKNPSQGGMLDKMERGSLCFAVALAMVAFIVCVAGRRNNGSKGVSMFPSSSPAPPPPSSLHPSSLHDSWNSFHGQSFTLLQHR